MRRLTLIVLTLACLGCASDPEKPEQQARTLQPYAIHTLPLGIRLDSLQKLLHGHSALFTPVVEHRMFRIIPLNAYDNQGYGAVELYPDSTIRTYYWYSAIGTLTPEQQRYYSTPRPPTDIKPVLAALSAAYGEPQKIEPYPNEAWYTWRNDSTSINLTLQNKSITLTRTGPAAAIVIDTTTPEPEPNATKTNKPVAKKAAPRSKAAVKKAPVKRTAAAKKKVVTPTKRKTTKKR